MILGDLNLNPMNESEKLLLELLCGTEQQQYLKEITTKEYNQLDHIVADKSLEGQLYATSFVNFISDHKTITARVGFNENKFSRKFLEKITSRMKDRTQS